MEFIRIPKELISVVENQYRAIRLTSWKNTTDSEQLWTEVIQYNDECGGSQFEELCEFDISTLVLPHSEVERIFCSMKNVKTKLRNRMDNKMCTSILAMRFGLIRHSKCCITNELPNDVRKI